MVAGLSDGNVAVWHLVNKSREPSYVSCAGQGKHSEPVWSVRWAPDNMDGHSNFYSCSSDGTIVNWTVLESHLVANIIIVIPFTGITRSEV